MHSPVHPPAGEAGFTKHVLSYYWDEFVPHLIYYDYSSGQVDEVDLFNAQLTISAAKRCVGFSDEEGYHPCPAARRVSAFSVCQSCMEPWIPRQGCVFEPQCTGDLCDHPEFCERDHVVYLAFFGTLAKVGMTSRRRLRTRGIEQGADAIAPIFRCVNRMDARALEREVSKRFRINQELRIKKVAAQMTEPPPWERIQSRYTRMVQRINFWRQTLEEPLLCLEGYPVTSRPTQPPSRMETSGTHRGAVLGVKGKYLIYENDGTHLLDLSDVPSRFIEVSHGK